MVLLLSQTIFNNLSPSDFLANPTPAGLAKKLDDTSESGYTYVVPLYMPDNSKKAVVLFPYAGGDAAAYTALTAKAREEKSNIALYFVDWPEKENMSAIEDELRILATKTGVCFYSHCAGSAVAMELLDRLNAEKPCIKGYIAGASIPPRKLPVNINVWSYMSDGRIAEKLKHAGLNLENEDVAILSKHIAQFRRHTQFFGNYFRRKTNKTNITVTAVVSRKDPFTKNFSKAKLLWQRVVTDVNKVVLIDTPSHYFLNTETALLLGLFSELPF